MPDSTDSSNSISVSKLLSDAIQSTLEAEKQGLMYYKDILSEFEAMDPISFRYFDDQGRALTINIPVLTLVPLSMLHIQEASFDFSVDMDTTENEPSISQASTSSASAANAASAADGKAPVRPIQGPLRRNQEAFSDYIRKHRVPDGLKPILQVRIPPQSSKPSNEKNTTTNMKITVKMGQSNLPSGVLEMLQKIGNSTFPAATNETAPSDTPNNP